MRRSVRTDIGHTQSLPAVVGIARKFAVAWLILSVAAHTRAEVTLDGTQGPMGSLKGPDFQIPDTMGRTVGSNLFHSFGVFNINTGESATFTGPASIENVISRVTGGSSSFIDAPLRSQIGRANFWFINPSGVLFGRHASLDVQGSFRVSTADYLKLGAGGRFDATHPENTVLTSAPPEAFGFLGENPASITATGSRLEVPRGKTLDLVGGDITLTSSRVAAPSGRIDLVSVKSPGEVPARPAPEAGTLARWGKIEISGSPEEHLPSVQAEGGGKVFIRAGEFTVAQTEIAADGNVSVRADNAHLSGGASIKAGAVGSRKGGTIDVKAHNLLLEGEDTGLFAPGSTGDGGAVAVDADRLTMRDGAAIGVSTFGAGRAGKIRVRADTMRVEGQGTGLYASAGSGSSGDAGEVTVDADDL
ncbi:MAG: filamentous hemagglutinin N-terminal domain-containing protein, partial [Methylococcaceae bacterium]|nr:filamentous hemagglutinin N-terminal domain-containing protein [Methylococcaceae bacterium]